MIALKKDNVETLYKYVSSTGLIDPTVSFDDYKTALYESKQLLDKMGVQTEPKKVLEE